MCADGDIWAQANVVEASFSFGCLVQKSKLN